MLRVDWNLLLTVINLLVLFVAIRIFLFKPVQKIIAQRQEEADKQFKEAEEKVEQAENLKKQYEKSLEDAEQEKVKILADTRKYADEKYQNIIKVAEQEAMEVRKEAIAEAESEKASIVKKAEQEISELIFEATKKVVGSHRGEEVDNELYNKFLEKAGDKS